MAGAFGFCSGAESAAAGPLRSGSFCLKQGWLVLNGGLRPGYAGRLPSGGVGSVPYCGWLPKLPWPSETVFEPPPVWKRT